MHERNPSVNFLFVLVKPENCDRERKLKNKSPLFFNCPFGLDAEGKREGHASEGGGGSY
jgi:hypothetical protein